MDTNGYHTLSMQHKNYTIALNELKDLTKKCGKYTYRRVKIVAKQKGSCHEGSKKGTALH